MNLVYFVIGADPQYSQLLEYCINTIRCYPENDEYDILVMCDSDYAKHVSHLPVKIHITPVNSTPVQSSMRKIEIFKVPDIEKYDKILYLDADIVVTGSLAPIFDRVYDSEKLYVKADGGSHTDKYWSRCDDPYDAETLARFTEHNIFTFNCGHFSFKNSPSMRSHFEAVCSTIEHVFNPSIHFYEQSFMNEYFCRNELVLYDISDQCQMFGADREIPQTSSAIVNHFTNASCPWSQKLDHMMKFHMNIITKRQIPTIETREHLSRVLQVPDDPVMAEIGIFRGDFAQLLFETFKPSHMTLIDPWDPDMICSGDQDGNDVVHFHGEDLFKHVTSRFENEQAIEIQRKYSSDAVIEPHSLDILYIDGDHSYNGVVGDLERAHTWVKYGGWICGHDFAMNPAKARHHYDFGVQRAVTEFCYKYGFKIWWLALDGCISFVIRR